MTTLRTIRKRLHSVQNIKQITKAMEMVASARLHRAQTKVEQARPYNSKIKQVLQKLAPLGFAHPLMEQRQNKKIGLVVITSDKGLCGAYNSNILSAADKFLSNYNQDNVELILIGRKAIDHFRRKSWVIRDQMHDWGEKLTFGRAKTLSNHLINWFLSGELDEIWLIYTHHINILTRKVRTEKFLNIEMPQSEESASSVDYIFEPNPQAIYAELLPRYCLSRILIALYDAYTSELAARIVAMRSATKNADEMIDHLTLMRNKVRQTSITRELIEIVSGSEGLK